MVKSFRSRAIQIFFFFVLAFFSGIILTSCGDSYTPRPWAYHRISMPQHEYQKFDTAFVPCTFDYPVYAQVRLENKQPDSGSWFTVDFPYFKGNLYLTYNAIDGDLSKHLEDSRKLTMKHIPKASAIDEKVLIDKEREVYGLLYDIGGSETASSMQFYLTDSTRHFLRGALYFYTVPNNDSLAPVLDFVRRDIYHLLESFEWKHLE